MLGILSLVASRVGYTFVDRTADSMFNMDLAWCLIPVGYGLSFLFGALLFAKPMRKAEYVTMLDPFQQQYGARVGGLMFLPALCGELFCCAALLRGLGDALGVVAGIHPSLGVCVTALVSTLYTASGGLYAVIWTDVLQLACVVAGLAIAAPYTALHSSASSLGPDDWLRGDVKTENLGEWLDAMLITIFGCIPWQNYFQHVLSIRSPSFARTLSLASMFGCLALTVPTALMGLVGRANNWHGLEAHNLTVWQYNDETVLPLLLRYLTPQWVSFVGLGAIVAGIMSSFDSGILAASSMFARNIYKLTMRPKATERELDWILRISVAIVSFLSAAIALSVSSVYYLACLCCELVYVVLFPQLLSVIHWPSLVDSYGCLAGYAVAIVIRISGGEKRLGIPVLVEYPFYDPATRTQRFPYCSAAMLSAIFAQLIVSFFTRNLLGEGYLPRCCDPLDVYAPGSAKNPNGVVPSSSGAALIDCAMNDASPGHLSDAPTTLSSSRTDYDASSTDTQLQQPSSQHHSITQSQTHQRYETISVLYNETSSKPPPGSAVHKPTNLRDSMSPKTPTATVTSRPGQHHHVNLIGSPVAPGQILGIKNLGIMTPAHAPDCINAPQPPRIMSPSATSMMGTPYTKIPTTIITNGRLEGSEKIVGGDRSNMELNLNLTDGSGIVKKNIKGVKLIGMEGGTLRRPSLQGTFSPTPSVELVNIFDRRQSSGSYGPSSLSPIPGVEACKTHGTAVNGQTGNEHCRIKRGIVRHHSFNDTGDRALTTLARQPNYPSMPLRTEDCRMTLRRDPSQKKHQHPQQQTQISRYSSMMDDKGLMEMGLRPEDAANRIGTLRRDKSCKAGHHGRYTSTMEEKAGMMGHLLVSPTYSMYNSAVKGCNYFVADDEAVSRF